MNSYRLGLVSVSFRPYTPEDILKAMTKAGLNYIEWGDDVHAPAGDMEKVGQLPALQKEYGVACSSYGSYFRIGVSAFDELPYVVEAAKKLGTNVQIVDPREVREENERDFCV